MQREDWIHHSHEGYQGMDWYAENNKAAHGQVQPAVPRAGALLKKKPAAPPSGVRGWFEVRLFYVRVSSCPLEGAPQSLTLRHHHRTVGVALEINGARIPPAESVSLTLRRDRVDKESAEATYVSTDSVRTSGTLDFEVCYDEETLLLCGALERLEQGSDHSGVKELWSMDCCSAIGPGGCPFGKLSKQQQDFSSGPPSLEVYVAGCCGGSPVILTKTVQLVSRRKPQRRGTLDVIPEDEDETEKAQIKTIVLSGHHSHSHQISEDRDYEELDEKVEPSLGNFYPEGGYIEGEDGELTWFNAGVRVGVGIGLGMCLGIGIGVGLLMRTYQATTRTFRRRLF